MRALTLLLVAIAALTSFWPKPASSQPGCSLKIRRPGNLTWNAGPGSSYSIFDADEHAQRVELTIEHRGAACSYFVTVSQGSSGTFAARTLVGSRASLRYNLYIDLTKTHVLKDLPSAQPTEVIRGALPAGDHSVRHQYVWIIEPSQGVPRGQYADKITLSIYEGTVAHNILRDRQHVRHTARVSGEVETAFLAAGGDVRRRRGSMVLDFGDLQEGETGAVWLRVRTNGSYSVALESEGGQSLRHIDAAVASFVGYGVTVDGQPVSLRSGAAVIGHGVDTGRAGVRYRIVFAIGSTTGAATGPHRDRLTAVVTAN